MAYYIFTQCSRPNSSWELLQTIETSGLAQKVFGEYRDLVRGQRIPRLAMVEAHDAREGLENLAANCKNSPRP